ncbi:GAF domain-containing sensor histidine kinase [Phenylobacterium sp.]|uniref:GAF domain-containing sensor histidine kinase n=1 Tax=Phenylobacterium sp. TaxID=1871053 RepID=UPI002734217E|nr:GAF domain-containing sensor histidine kinase [Phenylobacterium sp.]MDP3659134.1 GAF domain-containing sensor histidine kinase [Phenylobacterium sp.]
MTSENRECDLAEHFSEDLAAIARIDVIPKILEVVCRTTGMGFAAVARVTEDRWIACAVRDDIAFGLKPGGELAVTTTICNEIRECGQPVIIDHVAEDPLFAEHATPKLYGFQSYISVPIQHRGAFFGTLCAIDPRPAKLNTPEIRSTFELFADLIARHLAVQEQLVVSEAALSDAQAAAELREQFIAVLGHDLRNPLASIDACARLLLKTPLNDKGVMMAGQLQKSVRRMAELIADVLDFARGRLGGGFAIDTRVDPALGAALEQVIDEFHTAQPDRLIEADITLDRPIACDSSRIGQLLSNLVANALTHGSPTTPVRIRARTTGDMFELSVANGGVPIPEDTVRRLFLPFTRASAAPHQQGLGLGLYIASEIARAHAGELSVCSDAKETCFTFRMPIAWVAQQAETQRREAQVASEAHPAAAPKESAYASARATFQRL